MNDGALLPIKDLIKTVNNRASDVTFRQLTIIGTDGDSSSNPAVDTCPWELMKDDLLQEPRRRGIVSSGVLSVDSDLDRMSIWFLTRSRDFFQLGFLQSSLACHLCFRLAKHQLHEVNSIDHLRDPVLHLQSGVHLQKEEGAALVVNQELESPCTCIFDRLSKRRGRSTELSPQLRPLLRDKRAGTLLDHLLVPALDTTLPLPERRDLSFAVAKDLHLDVVGSRVVPLQEHPRVLEQRRPAGPHRLERLSELGLINARLQAHPAAAGRGLEHHGVPQPARRPRGVVGVDQEALRAGDDGHAGREGELPRRVLQAELLDALWAGADELQARRGDGAGKVCVLG